MPDNPNTAAFFNKLYSGTWEINNFSIDWVYEESSRLAFYKRIAMLDFFDCNGSILDVGCGMGGLFSTLPNDSRLDKFGIDFSDKAIEIIKKRVKGEFVVGDVHKLPYENGRFDRIICIETLEHVNYPDALIKEMIRVLRLSGKILITVPNKENDTPPENWPGGVSLHINQFTTDTLRQLISDNHLVVEFCDVVDGVIQIQARHFIGLPSPKVFAIETTLVCDLKCPECANGGGMIERAKGFMPFDRYKVIADKIQPFAQYVYLHIWGEPMLNPDIFKMITYTAQFVRTNISTNGMSLSSAKAEALILSGVSDIIISIDGISQEVYEKYRVGGSVQKAFESLVMLNDFNMQYGSKVNISPQFVVFQHNQHEMDEFSRRCVSLGLRPTFKAPYIRNDKSRFSYSDIPSFIRPHFNDTSLLRSAMRECQNPREVFTILEDGSVVVCCHDYAGVTSFGNIFQQEVMDVWNAPEYARFRSAILTGNAPEYCVKNCMTWLMDASLGKASKEINMRKNSGKRSKQIIDVYNFNDGLQLARVKYKEERYCEAIDFYEFLAANFTSHSIDILAELYDCYQHMPDKSRYALYQERLFDFGIKPGDKVLDIGSGHIPFPLATHLADITLTDHHLGRAGTSFKYVDGKPVYECSVEAMPFGDKEFDFVYCSHVLEHTKNPEMACLELMRVGKRGYIETPTRAKDIFLNSAKISNHTRCVELCDGKLVFTDYTNDEIEGFQCDILQSMHCVPQTTREKAFASLVWLKADLINTMLLWEGSFEFVIRANNSATRTSTTGALMTTHNKSTLPVLPSPPKFLQVHTFYSQYLDGFYQNNPQLAEESFPNQINALVRDGFSGIHIFAPYMSELGYESHFIVANNPHSQLRWLFEHSINDLKDSGTLIQDIVRKQVETIKPDVLYLSDPISFDGNFVRSLGWKPLIVLGWRAANIPSGIDWSSFDIMLSSLSALRKVAVELGARTSEYFFPGYPTWVNREIEGITPVYDVVFAGSWTSNQHPRRNRYITHLATVASDPVIGFSCGFFINCASGRLPEEVQRYNLGERFGVSMHGALRTGRIIVDARGILEYRNPVTNVISDLAGRETANMRIFEVTGSGRFLLAEHYDNIENYFEPGVEIETFRDENELIDKIHYYISHPKEREAIAHRGQERCLRDYSMEKRAAELDRIIRVYMPNVSVDEANNVGLVEKLRSEATQLIGVGAIQDAFDLLIKAKALRQPLEGIDVLRANCFLKMGQTSGAIEALREELRWFPGNLEARDMLSRLLEQRPDILVKIADDEFNMVLDIIRPYTMLSEQRLYSLYSLARRVCESNLQGNFVECGVAAGGSSALLAWVIKKFSVHPRRLFSFDSFSGMPRPTEYDSCGGVDAESTGWGTGTCAAPEDSVKEICAKLGVEDVLTAVKGYFEDTLPQMRDLVGMVALLHMDGDWYESTRTILHNLYDRLVNGAFIQVDDYGHWDGCRRAIHEFTDARSFQFDMHQIDNTGVWFVKPDTFLIDKEIPKNIVDDFMQDDPVPRGIVSQMSANERFQLYYAVRTLLPIRQKPIRFIEIGSYSGASLVLTCQALRRLGFSYQGVSVEPGGTAQFYEVIELLRQNVIHLPLCSHEASLRLGMMFQPGNLPEFIFVDGDHTYVGVKQDIIDYYQLLAPGGIMLFHDYLPELDDVNRAAIYHHHGNAEPGIRRACQEVLEDFYQLTPDELPLLYPNDPTQTQVHLPIIPDVFSTVRAYRKPL